LPRAERPFASAFAPAQQHHGSPLAAFHRFVVETVHRFALAALFGSTVEVRRRSGAFGSCGLGSCFDYYPYISFLLTV
jgi:hypothetical protein